MRVRRAVGRRLTLSTRAQGTIPLLTRDIETTISFGKWSGSRRSFVRPSAERKVTQKFGRTGTRNSILISSACACLSKWQRCFDGMASIQREAENSFSRSVGRPSREWPFAKRPPLFFRGEINNKGQEQQGGRGRREGGRPPAGPRRCRSCSRSGPTTTRNRREED